jgi:Hint domain
MSNYVVTKIGSIPVVAYPGVHVDVTITGTGGVIVSGAKYVGYAAFTVDEGSLATVNNFGTIIGGYGGLTPYGDLVNGGAGVVLDGGTLTNGSTGSITGGGGYFSDGVKDATGGGAGVSAAAGTQVTNSGLISGGYGGGGYGGSNYTVDGGRGGVGVELDGGTLINTATGFISGGYGGPAALYGYSGVGGIGLSQFSGKTTNAGGIAGGLGGNGGIFAGNGGYGVILYGGSLTNTATGFIDGGTGGTGATNGEGIGGTGVLFFSGGSLSNSGRIDGGTGGRYGDGDANGASGGTGVYQDGGTVTNTLTGVITGGSGGDAESAFYSDAGTGGVGGEGVRLSAGTLTNSGDIAGGVGGNNGESSGTGGAGAYVVGGMLTNTVTGTIAGGAAGGGATEHAGSGGDGVMLESGSVINRGEIDGGYSASGYTGGVGVDMVTGTLTNAATGTIAGGIGSHGVNLNGGNLSNSGSITGGGAGGWGVFVYGGTLTNATGGRISGGSGANSYLTSVGVAVTGGTVTNSGNITGGYGTSYGGLGLVAAEYGTVTNTATGTITGGSSAGVGGFGVYAAFQDGGTLVTNAGAITGGAGGVDGGVGVALFDGTIKNSGSISGGYGGVTGGIGLELGSDSVLTTSGAISGGLGGTASGYAVEFLDGSTLNVDAGAVFNGGIAGFAYGDTIDITNFAPSVVESDFNNSTDTLTTTGDGTLQFVGDSGKTFLFTSDGHGGTDVTIACFRRGTRILAERGEVPIESLKIGDRVMTASGITRPLRWIGRRSYSGETAWGNREVLPIRIRAGALGDGLPHRDLWVSPEHAMFIDGMLIPAAALVNGASIVQEEAVDEVTYLHLEFDSHAVIYAEGAAAESFVDDDSRAMFDNAAEYARLYPHATHEPARFCAPRVEEGEELEAVRRRLTAPTNLLQPLRAGIIGAPLRPDGEIMSH